MANTSESILIPLDRDHYQGADEYVTVDKEDEDQYVIFWGECDKPGDPLNGTVEGDLYLTREQLTKLRDAIDRVLAL